MNALAGRSGEVTPMVQCTAGRAPSGGIPGKQGFSLVSTVLILTLLALIAIGLLSLSTVTVRSNSALDAQFEARANARLALMLALGELQKQLGPDQRISATAAILGRSGETSANEEAAHPHWTGVWDSWAAGGEQHFRRSLPFTPDPPACQASSPVQRRAGGLRR